MRHQTFRFTIGDAAVSTNLQWRALAVSIDNPSSLWIRFPTLNTFVRPYWGGQTIVTSDEMAQFDFTNPIGVPATATIAGQFATITFYDTAMPPAAGSAMVVRAPSTEWRNPKGLIFYARQSFAGPVAYSSDWTYTVPAGRRARVDTVQVYAELSVSDGSGAGTLVSAGVDFFPLGSIGTTIVEASIWTGTALGARADAAVASSKELQSTDKVIGSSGNLRGAGVTVRTLEAAVITEGDA